MLIERIISRDGNLLPPAHNVIHALRAEWCFNDFHGSRHPKSSYQTSLRLINEHSLRVFRDLKDLVVVEESQDLAERMKALVQSQLGLLERVNEHADACISVFRSLTPPGLIQKKPQRFDEQYLTQIMPPGWQQFRAVIREFRESSVGIVVNSVKHRQGELCPIAFRSEGGLFPGYFLAGLLPGGSIGPAPDLHDGGNTAFSIARDIRFSLSWVYRLGSALAGAVTSLMGAYYGAGAITCLLEHHQGKEPLSSAVSAKDGPWNKMLRGVSNACPVFYPDETFKPVPWIQLDEALGRLIVEFPSQKTAAGVPPDARIQGWFTVDGAYLKHKVPYLGKI